jgi:hypothetical protein
MFAIALVVAVTYLHLSTRRQMPVALEKGIDEDDLTFFTLFLWFYTVPPLLTMLFVDDYSVLLGAIFAGMYIPGIVASRRLARKLDTGHDYVRRAGRDYDKAMWLGLAGVALVFVTWFLRWGGQILAARPDR